MLYNRQDLEKRVKSQQITKYASILEFAQIQKSFNATKTYDVFLSHSFLDAEYIKVIKDDFEKLGLVVYVDWIDDAQLSRDKVSKETADILRTRMKQCKSLFYVTTTNYQNSIWMPWELGYFDALKDKVAIVPVLSSSQSDDKYTGAEYLGLYYYVSINPSNGTQAIFINKSENEYVSYKEWIEGKQPYIHK